MNKDKRWKRYIEAKLRFSAHNEKFPRSVKATNDVFLKAPHLKTDPIILKVDFHKMTINLLDYCNKEK